MEQLASFFQKANIPAAIWVIFAVYLMLAAAIGWRRYRLHVPYIKLCSALCLAAYAALILCSTVLFRSFGSAQVLKPIPFWSYAEIAHGDIRILWEVVLNVLLFVPVGGLYKLAVSGSRWWTMLCVAVTFSFSIELMQYILQCGYTEVDDVLHNSLGALLGYGMAVLQKKAHLYNRAPGQ